MHFVVLFTVLIIVLSKLLIMAKFTIWVSYPSFGWGKGGKVTSAGWQVTLCDLIWHVISCSGVVILIANCYIRFTLLYFTLKNCL